MRNPSRPPPPYSRITPTSRPTTEGGSARPFSPPSSRHGRRGDAPGGCSPADFYPPTTPFQTTRHTLHTTGSRRRLTATASLAERRNDSAAPARLATPLATDSKRIRWTNPPAVGTSSQRRREGQPVVTGRRRLPPSPSCSLPVIALQ